MPLWGLLNGYLGVKNGQNWVKMGSIKKSSENRPPLEFEITPKNTPLIPIRYFGVPVGSIWLYGQKPWLCQIAFTKMALESSFLMLETCTGCLWIAETQTVQMRPSKSKSEVVTNWRIFQKPPRNEEKSQLPCRKMALEPKPCVHMTRETTQINRLGPGFDLAPCGSKSESVANWRIFQKLTTTPKTAILACFIGWNQSEIPRNLWSTPENPCTR